MKIIDPYTAARYQRQISLKGFGAEAQQKLARSRVLVVGAGGLGTPALLYLAAAGIGTIGIVDFDRVQVNNLHRQVLFTEESIGQLKTVVAARELKKRNTALQIEEFPVKLEPGNCWQVLENFDIILDGTDNFSTRYMLNDACVLLGKPLVMGAVSQFEGQVAIFNANGKESVNYRDIFPEPPGPGEILSCAEGGVLGVLPGIIGIQMANEVIKLIAEIGSTLADQLFTYNALTNDVQVFQVAKNRASATLMPITKEAFEKTDYAWLCGEKNQLKELSPPAFYQRIRQAFIQVIDVREVGELPIPSDFDYVQIPLSKLSERITEIRPTSMILFCQSGARSLKAAKIIQSAYPGLTEIYQLEGGLNQLLSFKNSTYAS
ncbi:HesA/MoeB/ThiF family protein [Flavihumibacter sp. CACIAM 22H1]|uniref:HesA/MoeB/ThiF family protein n=1 Tax=Flavihumibacter sp. CACIAM 22H1 TaxID=1812911 RepID=UPI0007A9091C|nr:HesA/MoeB/ThiF family protein [Flavihumibacter sp. CACIAM 22H1]KYP14711.1 MAG: hypothetical protein A1D16_14835 [Flavihumibacter sp. CACIAM 22H1]